MLCTELDLDPKIKVVTLVKYYNFYLGHSHANTLIYCSTLVKLVS